MKRLTSLIMAMFLSACLVQNVFAAAPAWEMDKNHSAIYFTIDHIFSKVRGHFNEFEAQIEFAPDNLKESHFNFEIKVDSIDTNISKRDKHLVSPDFFDAGSFPLITFKSKGIADKGDGLYEVTGALTVKGQERELTLPLVLAGVKEHPAMKDKEVAGFNGTITLDRLELGVGNGKFFKMGVVGKDVEVLVTLEVLKAK